MNDKLGKVTFLASLTLSLILQTGCYKMGFKGGSDGADGAGAINGKLDRNIVPGKTAQVLNFRAVGKSLSNLAGVPLSTQANTFLNNDITTYSLSSASDTITGPMLFNLAKLSAEVCLSLVNKEKPLVAANRKFYNSIDFTKVPAAQVSGPALDDAVNRVSRMVCGHDASAAMVTSIRSDLTAATTTNTVQDTSNAALMICTAYMSSACTVTNN